MTQDLRGVFFIAKGHYIKGVEPSFINPATDLINYIGGFNPERDDEWYYLIDRTTYECLGAGPDYNKIVGLISKYTIKYKDNKHFSARNSNEWHPAISTSMQEIWKEVDRHYGDYFLEDIELQEDLAYSEVAERTPYKLAKKKFKVITHNTEITPSKSEVINTSLTQVVKPKVRHITKLKTISEG